MGKFPSTALIIFLQTDASLSIWLLSIGIIGMLLLAIAIVIFFIINQRKLLNQQMHIHELETNYQKGLLNSMIQAQEMERKRIAVDLHDDVGGLLSATKLYIKQLQMNATEENKALSVEATGLIDNTISNIRRITRDLLPPTLEKFGLVAAIEDRIKIINQLGALKIHFASNSNKRFDPQKELNIFRIVQELINNTLKHAKAHLVDIQFVFEGSMLKVSYKDNGIGFDVEVFGSVANSPDHQAIGHGLRSLESRCNILDAKLDFQSEKGKGVHVQVHVDIGKSEESANEQKTVENLSS